MRIGILDQSPIPSGRSPREAIQETLDLARLAEGLGYHRYWLAEHHSLQALADPCPEVLVARVASITSVMRVGTGGVLLPYYAPLKVAEVFRMLEALFPGRIDLGLGRGAGGEVELLRAAFRLPEDDSDATRAATRYRTGVSDLVGFLGGGLPAGHPSSPVRAMPAGTSSPQVWILGSGSTGGSLAAELGLRFAFAHFINPTGGEEISRDYRARFHPAPNLDRPESLVCAFVVCAARKEAAERLALSMDLRRLQLKTGVDAPVPTVEEASGRSYSDEDRKYIQSQRPRTIVGDPGEVRDQLLALQDRFKANELMIVNQMGDYESRRESYRLVSRALGL